MKKILFSFLIILPALYSSSQNLSWQKTYGGTAHEYIIKTIPTSDGGYAFVGHSESSDGDVSGNHGMEDLWVAKINSAGTITWSFLYGGTQDDEGIDIAQANDGSYFVCGWTDSNDGNVSGNHSTSSSDLWVLHLRADGTIYKQKCFGGTSDDEGVAVALTTDGKIYFGGTTYSYDGDVSGNHGTYETDVWVLKTDTALNISGQKCIGGSDYEEGLDMKLTSDNGCIVAGRSSSADGDATGYHGGSDLLVAKLSSSLSIEWARCFGGTETEEGNSVVQLTDGNYAVLGYTSTQNNGDVTGHHGAQGSDDFWLLKIASSGILSWAKCYGGSGDDQANGLTATTGGGFAMCGLTNSTDGDVTGFHSAMFEPDIWIAKADASGTFQWQRCCGGTGQDESFRLFEEGSGVFVITGFTYSTDYDVTYNHGNADGWILKVTGAAGISENTKVVSFSVFPNPSTDKIFLDIPNSFKKFTIQIIDISGKIIEEKNYSEKCSSSFELNISGLKNGKYFIRLNAGDTIYQSVFVKEK
jgi:hypothetical protein